MTRKSALYTPLALALVLGFGPLPAQSPSQEGREAEVPKGQAETQVMPPVLTEPKTLAGMNLDFTSGAKLGEIFQDLSKHSGVSILLHASVPGQALSTSADLRGMNFQRVLDALMLQNDLFYKVMDSSSIMVFRKTPQNLQDFETRIVKTLYLANADGDSVRQNLNALMPQIRVFVDKRLSAITVSCTLPELAKVQQLVSSLDLAKGEVSLQMELLEVPQMPSAAAPLPKDGTATSVDDALARVRQAGDCKLLASPGVRVVAGETAEIRIGRKYASQPMGKGPKTAPTEKPGAVQSDDLGVTLKVRPRLHADHEITLELDFASTDPLTVKEPGRPNLSEHVLKTMVRVKDGETVAVGHLPVDEQSDSLPGSTTGGKAKKERILVVKAVLVRRAGEKP